MQAISTKLDGMPKYLCMYGTASCMYIYVSVLSIVATEGGNTWSLLSSMGEGG